MFRGYLRLITEKDQDMIFEWRNRDEIRVNMYNHDKITYETHKDWFKTMLNSDKSQYFIYEQENIPLGLVSFNNIDMDNNNADWAFYSANLLKRGVGSEMEKLALKYAFEDLNLNKLNCEVLDFNFPVVRFHQKHGFKLEGVKRQQYKRDDKYYDIYQLSLLRKDYSKLVKSNFETSLPKNYDWEFVISTSKADNFADITGDLNPIHMDEGVAKEYGFKNRIAHGAILVAEISKVAASHYPGPGTIYLGQRIDYSSPVYLNELIVGKAALISQVGRYCLIKYEISNKHDELIATSYSEFLIEK